jgi:hypothetical protein
VRFAPASGFRVPLPAAQRRRACFLPPQAVSARGCPVDDTTSSGVSVAPDMPASVDQPVRQVDASGPATGGEHQVPLSARPINEETSEAALAYLVCRSGLASPLGGHHQHAAPASHLTLLGMIAGKGWAILRSSRASQAWLVIAVGAPPLLASVVNPPSRPRITTSTDAPDRLTSRAASIAVSSARSWLQERLSSCPSLEAVQPLSVARIRKVRWTIDRASLSCPDAGASHNDQTMQQANT